MRRLWILHHAKRRVQATALSFENKLDSMWFSCYRTRQPKYRRDFQLYLHCLLAWLWTTCSVCQLLSCSISRRYLKWEPIVLWDRKECQRHLRLKEQYFSELSVPHYNFCITQEKKSDVFSLHSNFESAKTVFGQPTQSAIERKSKCHSADDIGQPILFFSHSAIFHFCLIWQFICLSK